MSFSVLSNTTVKSLLSGLKRPDVLAIQAGLNKAFTEYSLNNEADYQVHRTSVTRPSGQTTLFMPATSPTAVGAKIIGVPPPTATGKTLAGVLVLCDTEGNPTGILNASEITGFRTALGSMTLLPQRKTVTNVVVFGAGKQAFYHVKLALLLREQDIKKVTIVNRSVDRSKELVEALSPFTSQWNVDVSTFEPTQNDYEERLQKLVQEADVIFCTTPSKTPLFPAKYLDEAIKQGKGPYIGAIGSYKIEMTELDPVLFQNLIASENGYHPKKETGGVIVVDTREGCFQESGEIVQGNIPAKNIVEIGELLDIQASKEGKQTGLDSWLSESFVIYKSVGMGVMDLAVGASLITIAKEKEAGVVLPPL